MPCASIPDIPAISQALWLLDTLIARAHRSHLTGARRELLDEPRNDPDEVERNPGAAETEGP